MGAIQVTSSRKGAKSRKHGLKSRSTRTKARARVGQVRKPRTDLKRQLETYKRELNEARAQQAATSEVLRVISGSPGALEPVFNAMLENALRICEAKLGMLLRYRAHPIPIMQSAELLSRYGSDAPRPPGTRTGGRDLP